MRKILTIGNEVNSHYLCRRDCHYKNFRWRPGDIAFFLEGCDNPHFIELHIEEINDFIILAENQRGTNIFLLARDNDLLGDHFEILYCCPDPVSFFRVQFKDEKAILAEITKNKAIDIFRKLPMKESLYPKVFSTDPDDRIKRVGSAWKRRV